VVSTLRASVSAGESGPVITLSGQADITHAAELSELIAGHLAEAVQQLTVDVAGLDFADTAAIRVFLVAGRRQRQRGSDLVLLRPQRALARVLEILGADEVVKIRGETEAGPEPEP
jgi:anti-sigma B factor antagonist